MDRPGTAFAPLPFLRLVRTDGTVRAQLFVFWRPGYLDARQRPQGPDVVCRDGICVKPIEIKEQRDWEKAVASLADQSACPPKDSSPLVSPTGGISSYVTVCPHCPLIWIKTAVDGKYREQACAEPGPDTGAGALFALMKSSARASGF